MARFTKQQRNMRLVLFLLVFVGVLQVFVGSPPVGGDDTAIQEIMKNSSFAQESSTLIGSNNRTSASFAAGLWLGTTEQQQQQHLTTTNTASTNQTTRHNLLNDTTPTAPLVLLSPRQQQQQQQQQQDNLHLPHSDNLTNYTKFYYLHIPKAGGRTMYKALTAAKLGYSIKNYGDGCSSQVEFDTFLFDLVTEELKPYPRHRFITSEGNGFRNMVGRGKGKTLLSRINTNSSSGSTFAMATMLRDPVSHVTSQYFHCRETYHRTQQQDQRPIANVTLQQWLEYWNDIHQKELDYRNSLPLDQQFTTHHRTGGRKSQRIVYCRDAKYDCYSPLNYQTWLMGYEGTLHQSQQQPSQLHKTLVSFLQSHFAFIGDLGDFTKSACLLMTLMEQSVPPPCDCTEKSAKALSVEANTHGVKHHGSGHPLTDYERSLIHNITKVDKEMYEAGQKIFRNQVNEVEDQFGITLCGNEHSTS